MFGDAQNASVTRSTPDLPKLRWHQYFLSQKQIHLKSSPLTSSLNSLSHKNMIQFSSSLIMTAQRRPSLYPVWRRSQQRGWQSSLSRGYSGITDSPGKSSVTGTPDLHQSSPRSCAASWASNRTFPRLITPGRTDNQKRPISGWRPISDSLLTISRTIGWHTCP